MNTRPWNTYGQYLQDHYGYKVFRIGVDGGFSCPNRESGRTGGCHFCDTTGAVSVYQRTDEGRWAMTGAFQHAVSLKTPRKMENLACRIAGLQGQVERGERFIKRRYHIDKVSLYFQAWTSTYADVDELKAIYDAGLQAGNFEELIVSTRPDCLSDQVIDLLHSYQGKDVGEVWVEIGLQSANDTTLERIGRGHDTACYIDAVQRVRAKGLRVSTHVINGLPGETASDYVRTAKLVSDLGCEAIKIHNLDISAGTQFHGEYLDGELTVPTRSRVIENCIIMLRNLSPDVIVERMLCETPKHRLVAPRTIGNKESFLRDLETAMREKGYKQGDLYDAK